MESKLYSLLEQYYGIKDKSVDVNMKSFVESVMKLFEIVSPSCSLEEKLLVYQWISYCDTDLFHAEEKQSLMKMFDYLNKGLTSYKYLCGNNETVADILIFFTVQPFIEDWSYATKMSTLEVVPVSPKPIIKVTGSLPVYVKKVFTNLFSTRKGVLIGLGIGGLVAVYTYKCWKKRKSNSRRPAIVNYNDIPRQRKNKPLIIRSPSGELHNFGITPSIPNTQSISGSESEKDNFSSLLTTQLENGSGLTPQQYGLMGLEALEGAINLWDEALTSYTKSSVSAKALPTQEQAEFTECLQKVISEAFALQDTCEQLFLHQQSILFRSFDITPEGSEVTAEINDRRTLTSISSLESFVSAHSDIADLSDLAEFEELPPLYVAAQKHHETHGIPYRDIRTEWCQCENDIDYLCKVHCLRLACHVIFSKKENKLWFSHAGRNIIQALLIKNDKDPKEALVAYDNFLEWFSTCDWGKLEKEMQSRGIKAITFYDVVLDFILMDAFDDLENPPSSVIAVINNKWLSTGFKESALSTAVWSVLKAKRRMLSQRDGLVAHFYDVTEHLSPTLAWGFLGTDFRYRETCVFFKDQIQSLVRDMFNFNVVRYTTVAELSQDLVQIAKQQYEVLIQGLTDGTQVNGCL